MKLLTALTRCAYYIILYGSIVLLSYLAWDTLIRDLIEELL